MNSKISLRRIKVRYLIAAAFFVAVFSALIFYDSWVVNNSHLDEMLRCQAKMGLEFDLAIRDYVAESVRPFAEDHLGEDDFIPQVMSTSFVARSILEKVRAEFPDYIVKFSSDNPRNPANQAGPEELEMIEYFNENPAIRKWSGHITIDGRDYLACFSARRAEKSCLGCHGDPADAPRALVAIYGDTAGFHRPVGKVIALDTVAIPTGTGKAAVLANTTRESILLISGLCLFVAVSYLLLRWLVAKLSRQNRFLHTVVESLAHPFYVIDADNYRIRMANSATCGGDLPPNATCYKTTHNKDLPCDGAENPCPIRMLKEGSQSVIVEHVHYDEQGRARNVEVHAHPIVDAQGNLSEIIEYSFDITKRKKEESQLQDSMAQLEQFNSLAIGRELRMMELKKEIDNLLQEAGRGKKYRNDYEAQAGNTLDEGHSTDGAT